MRCIHDDGRKTKGEGSAAFTGTITMMENIKARRPHATWLNDVAIKALKVHDERNKFNLEKFPKL